MGYAYNANKSKPGRKPRWRIAYDDPTGELVDEKGLSTEVGSRALLAMREKDVVAGCWSPLAAATGAGGMQTVTEYATRHNARRVEKRKALAVDGTEWGRMKNHVLPLIGKMRMDRVEREDIERVISSLMQAPDDDRLAPTTILAVYGQLRVMFKWAVAKDKIIAANPCTLTLDMDELPQKRDKDPRWRETAKYARKELVMLLTDARLPPDRHMVYALEFLGAMRAGEAAGRRWVDFDQMEEPLEKLLVVTQYDDQPTKTRRPRGMPVHPVLGVMLREFRNHWWPILYGREAELNDFIVPVRGAKHPRPNTPRTCRSAGAMYTQLQSDLAVLGLRRRRAHDLRRTLISMAQAGRCSREALKACTHGSKGDIISDYTTWAWEDLCAAISCVKFELPPQPPTHVQLVPEPDPVVTTGTFKSKSEFVRAMPLDMPIEQVVRVGLNAEFPMTTFDVYAARRAMRRDAGLPQPTLASARARRIERLYESPRAARSLTPSEKASVGSILTSRIDSRITGSRTEIGCETCFAESAETLRGGRLLPYSDRYGRLRTALRSQSRSRRGHRSSRRGQPSRGRSGRPRSLGSPARSRSSRE